MNVTVFRSLVLVSLLFIGCNKQQKKVYQPGEGLGKDLIISEAYPYVTYSELDKLHVLSLTLNDTIDNDSRFLLRIGFTDIPPKSKIDSAYLYLKAMPPGHFGEDNGLELHRITTEWRNDIVAWVNRPKVEETPFLVVEAPTEKLQDFKIDLTDFVRDVVNDRYPNLGFSFRLQNEEKPHKGLRFCSSNHQDPDYRPKLEIYFRR